FNRQLNGRAIGRGGLLLRAIFTIFTHRCAIREDRMHLGKSKMSISTQKYVCSLRSPTRYTSSSQAAK
ncbi:MAG: hypothetical protein K2H65_04625, partial [Bacteroidales bacterium]|nr:hypothetical protein [Bacteroidales bacterium]